LGVTFWQAYHELTPRQLDGLLGDCLSTSPKDNTPHPVFLVAMPEDESSSVPMPADFTL
jgi:hypothetical protein